MAHDSDPATYVTNALGIDAATAEVTCAEQRRIRLYVDSVDYPRAVGKAGRNVHLAHELTGWAIEIKTRDAHYRPVPSSYTTHRLVPTGQ
ncbi:hypothetical protein O982_23840 [Mycobacterium avium 10-5581]|nr:hypothetical protein O982_23840 [Mycobacterium avium 10-5581]